MLDGGVPLSSCFSDVLPKPLNDTDIQNISVQLINGISFLHRLGFAHLDIKLDNLLYDQGHRRLTIVDFNLAQHWRNREFETAFRGTVGLTAPEVGEGEWNTLKADAWACGDISLKLVKYCQSSPLKSDLTRIYIILCSHRVDKRPRLGEVAMRHRRFTQLSDVIAHLEELGPDTPIPFLQVPTDSMAKKVKAGTGASMPTSRVYARKDARDFFEKHGFGNPQPQACEELPAVGIAEPQAEPEEFTITPTTGGAHRFQLQVANCGYT